MYSQSSSSPSIDRVVDSQLYIGNLASARALELREQLGITHIVSVCQDFHSTGPNHLSICVADSEYEDILIHLPKACTFIQKALDESGRVLVHCVMGVSRSTTVLAAYLMQSRHLTPTAALRILQKSRPSVMPNYGFLKQLDVFAECGYCPTRENQSYICWKRMQEQHVTRFLTQMIDTTPIIPEQLLLSSEFPDDVKQAVSLVQELGITHILSVSPYELPPLPVSLQRHDLKLSHQKESLLTRLPEACMFIRDAIAKKGLVLVHSLVECKAAIVVCSYLMQHQKMSINQACRVLEDALPLFNRTSNFTRHLELFDACAYIPAADHPLVLEWTGQRSPLSSAACHKQVASILTELSEKKLDINEFENALQNIRISHAEGRRKQMKV
ncbi:phosphatases II [Marasmius fiardii PR-910]|nr:phosphatases II [Marasmius fiardii PR-910]